MSSHERPKFTGNTITFKYECWRTFLQTILQVAGKSVRILSSDNNEDKIYIPTTQKFKSCSSQAFIHNIHIRE